MSAARNLCLIAVLLLTPFLAAPNTSAAQPVQRYPFGYTHSIPFVAMDLLPGQLVEVGIWVELQAGMPLTTIQYNGQFGSLLAQASLTNTGPSFNSARDTLTAEEIMEQCIGGVIPVTERILQQDTAGDFTILVHRRERLIPCRWASSEVTPSSPVQYERCGDENDSIEIGRQVPGLSWNEGVWKGNTFTVTFTADAGYTLNGQDTFTFTDSGGCTVGPAISPVRTYVCGENNDRLTLQPQPPEITLVSDSGWIRNQRIVRYGTEPTYTLEGSAEFRFTDDPNLLCPSPIRTPPVVVLTPRATFPPIVIRPTPRGFPAPVITIVPTPTLPAPWTPTDTPKGWTPAPPIWNPIPLRPTPRGFPMPRVTFVPLVQPMKPTPVTEIDVSKGTYAAGGAGKSVVMALAPAAIILGAIAASRRRDD